MTKETNTATFEAGKTYVATRAYSKNRMHRDNSQRDFVCVKRTKCYATFQIENGGQFRVRVNEGKTTDFGETELATVNGWVVYGAWDLV